MLVSKDKEKGIAEFVFVQHALQFFPGLDNTVAIVAVDNEDDTLGILEIMPPERTDLILTTNVPHGELDVPVFDSLDVETYVTEGQMSAGLPFTREGAWKANERRLTVWRIG